MGFGDFVKDVQRTLFGGSEQGSNTQQQVFGPQADFLTNTYYPYLTNLQSQYSQNPQSLIAPFNQTQQLGQNLGVNQALSQIPQIGQAQNALQSALDPSSALSPFLSQSLQATLNPFVRAFQQDINPLVGNFARGAQDVADRFGSSLFNLNQDFSQNVIPGIRGSAVGVGQAGSSREGIAQGLAAQQLGRTQEQLGRAASREFGGLASNLANSFAGLSRGFGDQLGNITSQAQQNAFNQGIEQRLRALGLAPSISQLGFAPSQQIQNIGNIQQGLAQQYASAPLSFASQFGALLPGNITLSSGNTFGNNQRGFTQGFGDITGGSGSFLGGLGSILGA